MILWRGFLPVLLITGAFLAVGLAPARADFADGYTAFQDEDFVGAWDLLLPEAEAGDKRAQFLLGEMLLKGLGREIDAFSAAGWFQKAVREPDPDRYALYALASQYFSGDGVPQDVPNALILYQRAASLGDLDAMRSLAAIYARGQGDDVAQDLDAALRWLFVAAATGDPASSARFDRLSQAAGGNPPFSGRWVAIAYLAPADHPSWQSSPGFLPGLIGDRLTLGNRSFAMSGATCGRPTFISGTTTAASLLASMAGVLPYGGLAVDDRSELTTAMVVCDGALIATMVQRPDGSLLVSALGGVLMFDVSPSPTVESAQRMLLSVGYDPGPIDGLFGPRTGAALLDFQVEAGLLPTGAFDAATMFALAAAASESEHDQMQPGTTGETEEE